MTAERGIGVGPLGALVGSALLGVGLIVLCPEPNPFAQADICFREEHPGATERFTEYVPGRCSDRSQALAAGFGADHAQLSFADTDGDHRREVTVRRRRMTRRRRGPR